MNILNSPLAYSGLLLADLRRFVEDFLLQLEPGSVFVLDRETGPGFLQFAIVEREDKWLKVEFGLPDAKWCRKQFDLVHAAMADAGYSNEVETNPGNKDVPRFLRVSVEGIRDELPLTLLRILELAANKLKFEVTDRYTLRMIGEISSEYANELATSVEQLPRARLFTRMLAKLLRRLSHQRKNANNR